MQIPGEEETIPKYVNRQKATILDNTSGYHVRNAQVC
jgi:hypothetical protein